LDQRFRPADRLRNRAAFSRIFRRNVRSTDALFTVLARPNDEANPRLGLAISVRAAGGAVSRNRIKRVVRETFRQHRDSLPPADVVVMARPGIAARSNAQIRASLLRHWERIANGCKR
jgi:ribonuclease P protein component